MADVAERISALSPKQRELLELRIKERAAAGISKARTILPRRDKGPAPLSFAQERLWFLDQLEPGNPVFNMPNAFRLEGPLDSAALECGFNEIMRRHEVLRTTFASISDGHTAQVIAPSMRLALRVIDLRELPGATREIETQRVTGEDAGRSFNLAEDTLLRTTLLWLTEQEHVLLLTKHHIVSDAWSMGIMLRELAVIYNACLTGEPVELPRLPLQYADFAQWQRQWLEGEELERQASYWKQRLLDVPLLALPTARPRPPRQTYRGKRQYLRVSKKYTEALRSLSFSENATLFMTLLAAFKVLLHRYTGQDDIVVGTPVANRDSPDIEDLIGFFVNTLAVRTDLSTRPRFREMLGRIRSGWLESFAHKDLPFEKLVEELQPQRDLGHNPLFQVMFVFQNARDTVELQGLTFRPVRVGTTTAMFDLTLFMTDANEGLTGSFEYNVELFEADRIDRMVGHFETLLESIISDPDQRVSDLVLLTEDERRDLLIRWNDTHADVNDACLHGLFEAQVEKTPEAVAVVFEEEQVTYGELNRRANQLAHYLRGLGVGPEVLVGIMMERSVENVVGLMGILKAGGAYVPLDPDYPRERLEFMICDSRLSVLVTQGTSAVDQAEHRTPQFDPLIRVFMDQWDTLGQQPGANPESPVSSANAAYVIYTSGSTGQPKGVQIRHGSLVNFLNSMTDKPGIANDDSLLSVTTLAFDIAGLELFLPLVSGARTVLVSQEVANDGAALGRRLDDVTMMQATPATWQLLVEARWAGCPTLRMLCGGEALWPSLAGELVCHGQSLWNLYGPTETTIWSTMDQVITVNGDTTVSIGRPIANTEVYIVDASANPVPVGVVGELWIGGAGVARGYLNRPDVTAEKFVPHRHTKGAGARLYKTGDLTRYAADGNVEFLGRLDHQVKVRGFRIELGEIEAVLGQHPAVNEAVVLARGAQTVDHRRATGQHSVPETLVAYVAGLAEHVQGSAGLQKRQGSVGELRKYVGAMLPEFMVPRRFVVLDALPRTPNGKVDRKALPELDWERPELESSYVAPRTETEEVLTRIWAELLNLDQVGIYDNFFELGGHSLLAARVVQRTRDALRVEVPLRSLFESATVAELAELIDTMRWVGRNPDDASSPSTEEETFE